MLKPLSKRAGGRGIVSYGSGHGCTRRDGTTAIVRGELGGGCSILPGSFGKGWEF